MQRATPREISGRREDRGGQKPFRKPGGKPFGKPFGPGGGFRKKFPRPEPTSEAGGASAPNPPKFFERFLKKPRQKPDERQGDQGGPPRSRWLQSSERTERIPSSAGSRAFSGSDEQKDYRDRPGQEDYRRREEGFRGDRLPSSGRQKRMGAASGARSDFSTRPRRGDFTRRDDERNYAGEGRRERPFRPPGAGDGGGSFSRPQPRPAPHLEKRIIRSEGAKADQRPLPAPVLPAEKVVSRAREVAARVLLRRLHASAYVEDLLEDAFAATRMRPDDRRLAQELTYGCVRWQGTLDWLVARRTDDRPQLATVQVFLRLGLYQLFFLDRIPPHAACYETVELSKQLGCGNQSNFINAVLRRSEAEREVIKAELAEIREASPHLGYSHPQWLVQKWTDRWGMEDTRKLLEWDNAAPAAHVRVNLLKTTPEALIERWRLHENVEYDLTPCPWAEDGHVLTLKSHPPLAAMGSFREGWFYVQDPSTLLAVQAVDAWAGESILDLCAAPGGKTCYLAQKMENDGELVACDTAPERLKLVAENCGRLGVTCARTLALGDHPDQVLFGKRFDKILVDAPCSNTGVLRRRLDLRWRLRPEEISRLRATQLKLVALAARHLKPGGTLVYSTCSLEPEENTEVVKEFLAAHPMFKLESERDLLPFRDGVDGAYVARLRQQS